ncbi:MAG: hypothetical protein ACRC92_21760 [Peptostreptococcaceae bacterium]
MNETVTILVNGQIKKELEVEKGDVRELIKFLLTTLNSNDLDEIHSYIEEL